MINKEIIQAKIAKGVSTLSYFPSPGKAYVIEATKGYDESIKNKEKFYKKVMKEDDSKTHIDLRKSSSKADKSRISPIRSSLAESLLGHLSKSKRSKMIEISTCETAQQL